MLIVRHAGDQSNSIILLGCKRVSTGLDTKTALKGWNVTSVIPYSSLHTVRICSVDVRLIKKEGF